MSHRRRFLFQAVWALSLFGLAPAAQAVDEPRWQLPAGFTIEKVAGAPLVRHPTMGCFDDRGRLYICDGPGDNLPAKDLLEQLPHSIKRLEDVDGDGRFDRVVTFADKMVFPMGAVWHDGVIYTASPPNIWRLRDTDDDGVADERKIIVSEFGFTGNAADVHGCFLGPDGRIYWCDGRHGHTFIDEQGKTISKGLAARLFSCRPDGSDVEAFAGGGMDNPVEVAFTEEGEPIGTVAIYENQPDRVDALIHWVYGGVYPYAEKVLGEFKKTGPLLPAVRYYGRVAPSGIMRSRSPAWGGEYVNNLFHVQFNTHRLIRTKLTRDGATFRGEDQEFLISENQDVHLTDVLEDADGSLLVVDTGGWFRIGCPNSQIAKPEIVGGIYRIRKTDANKSEDPYGRTLNGKDVATEELLRLLGKHQPPMASDRAMNVLIQRGKQDAQIVEALSQRAGEIDDSCRSVWTLAQIGTPTALEALRHLANSSKSEKARVAALRALGTLSDASSSDVASTHFTLERMLLREDGNPAVRREAATALGRLKRTEAIPSLLAALKTANNDRFLEHAIIYALIEINDGSQTIVGLSDAHAAVRRGALIALDQNQDPRLTRDVVAKLLNSPDAGVQRAALEVMQRHPDWGDGILSYLQRRLADDSVHGGEQTLLRDTILAYKADARVQQLVADSLANVRLAHAQRLLLLEVIERSEFAAATIPPLWAEQLSAHLDHVNDEVVRQAVTAAARIGGGRFDQALLATAQQAGRPEDLRIAALGAVGNRVPAVESALFELLIKRLTSAADPLDRAAAAKVLGLVPLDAAQRAASLQSLAKAGPLELPALLEAFAKPSAAGDGPQLVAALAAAPGLENVTSSSLEKLLVPYPAEVRTAAEPLFKRINADIDVQRARLAELSPQLEGGDPKLGAIVFQMAKTACSSCHRVGVRGTAIGPDLTKVGLIRAPSDLLESVVYPSASFVRNYESVAIETSDGRVIVGLLTRETPAALYIRTPQKEEVRVPRSDVETIAPSKLSIMPQGMDKIMSPTELRDLLAYLRSLK